MLSHNNQLTDDNNNTSGPFEDDNNNTSNLLEFTLSNHTNNEQKSFPFSTFFSFMNSGMSILQLIQAKNFNAKNVNQLLNIANTGVSTLHSLWQLFEAMYHPTEEDIKCVQIEREAALKNYNTAFTLLERNSLGSALEHINDALNEFNKTAYFKKFFEIIESKDVYANILILKALILHRMKKYAPAVEVLINATAKNPKSIMAQNLLAFIYIQHIKNNRFGRRHLEQSKYLSNDEIFPNFYLGLLNKDYELFEKSADNLFEMLMLQAQATPDQLISNQLFGRFITYTPMIAVPRMLIDWLKFKIEQGPQNLVKNYRLFDEHINNQPKVFNEFYAEGIYAIRINALMKIHDMIKSKNKFDDNDIYFLQSYALFLQKNDVSQATVHNNFFYLGSKDYQDKVINKLLSLPILDTENHLKEMPTIIAQWALKGLLPNEQPLFAKINSLLKNNKKKIGDERKEFYKILLDTCNNKTLINTFISVFLTTQVSTKDKKWENLLKTIEWDADFKEILDKDINPFCSLIYIIANTKNINLKVYVHTENGIKHEAKLSSISNHANTLHIVHNPLNDVFVPVDAISSPSSIYRRMAFDHCYLLLKCNPQNKMAKNTLTKLLKTPEQKVTSSQVEYLSLFGESLRKTLVGIVYGAEGPKNVISNSPKI